MSKVKSISPLSEIYPDYPILMSTKQQKSCKVLADMLHYEGLLYCNQLIQFQGTFLPRTPLRPVTGNQDV
jgi:hypothetical protein